MSNVTIDGIIYLIDGSFAHITGYDNNLPLELHIPLVVSYSDIDYSVVSIKNSAFLNASIGNVIIPASIAVIEDSAFENCSSMYDVVFDTSSVLTTIGNYAFKNTILSNSVIIPNSVISIGSNAFENTSLSSIVLSSSLTQISANTFNNCSGLAAITIPASVTDIGNNAFNNCSSLSVVTFLGIFPTIGSNNFNSNSENTVIFITELNPNANTNTTYTLSLFTYKKPAINNIVYSFINLNATIESYLIPPNAWNLVIPRTINYLDVSYNVSDLAYAAFTGCSNLVSVNLPNTLTIIPVGTFAGCSNLTTVILPDTITALEESSFRDCISLVNINIPNSVTYINGYVFTNCQSLASINLPNSITFINYNVFENCTSLTSVNIPTSLLAISGGLFSGCTSLTTINLHNLINYIEVQAFSGCTSLTSITIPPLVTEIKSYTFFGCTGLVSVTIPTGLTGIGTSAFTGCSSLININFPDSIIGIGDQSFSGCTSLKNIVLPNNITIIGNDTFANCTSLESIILPLNLTSLGVAPFANCTSLKSIIIPPLVTEIRDGAFDNCTSLKKVIFLGLIPTIGTNNFNTTNNVVVYYASLNIDNTVNVQNMLTMFTTSEVIVPFTINNVIYSPQGINAVISGFNLEPSSWNLIIPSTVKDSFGITYNVTSIGNNAFENCTNLKCITIPSSVTSIGNNSFQGCNNLISVLFFGIIPTIGTGNFTRTGDTVIYNNVINANNSANVQNMLTMFSTATILPISSICFIEENKVETDQGLIEIQNIDENIHTINDKKIVSLVKTFSEEKYLVCIEKDAFGENIPSQDTVMSTNHKLVYNEEMIEVCKLIGKNDKIYKINYNGEILYNILMEDYDNICVNNLTCENLHPLNRVAQLYLLLKQQPKEMHNYMVKCYNDKFAKKIKV